jgi:hypothetical protein
MNSKNSFLGLAGEPLGFGGASTHADMATTAVACSDKPIFALWAGLNPADCHLAIINSPTDPTVSALDSGPNPPVHYPNCAAQ